VGVFVKRVLIILLLLLVFVIGIGSLARAFLILLYGLRPKKGSTSGNRPFSRNGRFGNEEKAERMLACSTCGVHVPESEGIKAGGKFFCCEAHRK